MKMEPQFLSRVKNFIVVTFQIGCVCVFTKDPRSKQALSLNGKYKKESESTEDIDEQERH